MPIDPNDVHHATSTGTLSAVSAGLATTLGAIGGFVFREQNKRLTALEQARIDLGAKMATKDDIELIYEKVNHNHEVTINRIVEIIRDGR